MGLAAQQQVRQMYVGDVDASNTSIGDLSTAGNLIILSADGSAVGAGKEFKVFQLDSLGKVASSDAINPAKTNYVKSVAHEAEVKSVWTVGGITADANTLYTVNIGINGYGSLSDEDTYLKKGFYKAIAGDNAEAIVDGLIASLKRNFSREPGANEISNPYFSFTKTGSGATAVLVITELDDWAANKFNADQFTRTLMDFYVDVNAETYPSVENTVPNSKGVATGRIVASMEHYLVGERGDFYRYMGYPNNLKNKLYADPSLSYNLIEIGYYEEGRDEAKKSNKQITLAVPNQEAGNNAPVNSLVADLNTIYGAGSVTTLPDNS
jgi:hypothetical protein